MITANRMKKLKKMKRKEKLLLLNSKRPKKVAQKHNQHL